MIDSHCHLDASEFNADRHSVLLQAYAAGIRGIVNPAVEVSNFSKVADLSAFVLPQARLQQVPYVFYTLGIHPLFVQEADKHHIDLLRQAVTHAVSDPLFVGVGEIGLDGFVPGIDQELQSFFFVEQLKIAKEFDLPVVMHVRKAQDSVLKQLRRFKPISAIAHAFNGSQQQAQAFIDLNCVLGFGGAMTFSRALQIRRLAQLLPLESIVLETDSPDISPAWLHPARNQPTEVARIADCLADLRGVTEQTVCSQTDANVARVLPRIKAVFMGEAYGDPDAQ
jgi:TatD DNase family protein